jgi:hypothetical protein
MGKPRLDPNPSFDLCRLACSIYDFIEERKKRPREGVDKKDDDAKIADLGELRQFIHTLCLDDNGKHVLYKKNGEERYPGFRLYKSIARFCHHQIPADVLSHSFFAVYKRAKE